MGISSNDSLVPASLQCYPGLLYSSRVHESLLTGASGVPSQSLLTLIRSWLPSAAEQPSRGAEATAPASPYATE